jgi:uncharacterized protein YbbC (DUF1343 family)
VRHSRGVRAGIDIFEKQWPRKFIGARVGLLVHPSSVNKKLEHTIHLFLKSRKLELKALFGPQHGIRGETQDNMIEWNGFTDKQTGLPVYSLYSKTRQPEPAMLNNIDLMVIDLQDIGSRYYTYIWTAELCMRACVTAGKSLLILDRPNPLGGTIIEGPVLDINYASFIGQRPLPARHGMTLGEICWYLKSEYYVSLDFHVVPVHGWKREQWFDTTGLPWVMPSPNMPTPETALVYPGSCLLEGTNLSEGRGTTRPFEIIGAPFIDPEVLVRELKPAKLFGVMFRPIYFQPTFQKYVGGLCGGVQIHVTNRERFKPFKTAVAVLKAVHKLYPKHFAWKKPPYEYEMQKMPIDILAGTDRLRKDIERGATLEKMEEWWREQSKVFQKNVRKQYLIYK